MSGELPSKPAVGVCAVCSAETDPGYRICISCLMEPDRAALLALEAQLAEARKALEEIAELDAAWKPGWKHWAQIAREALDRLGAS